jgi:hypothetical protein
MELSGQLIFLGTLSSWLEPPEPIIDQEAECASKLVWTFWKTEESLAAVENQTLVCDLLRTKV